MRGFVLAVAWPCDARRPKQKRVGKPGRMIWGDSQGNPKRRDTRSEVRSEARREAQRAPGVAPLEDPDLDSEGKSERRNKLPYPNWDIANS